ncbi:MAG: T9SS type A sorting domain-containing protein [Saprospiraceae bacterium]
MKKIYTLGLFLCFTLAMNAQSMVTISVDMNGVSQFTAGSDVMKVGGDFNGWTPDNTTLEDPDGNGVYAATFETFPGGVIMFKFVINAWETNEFHPDTPGTPGDCTQDDGGGNTNRVYMIPADAGATHEMPIFKYNTCDLSELPVNIAEATSTISQINVAPNPFATETVLTLENTTSAAHDLVITNMTGQVVRIVNDIVDNTVTIAKDDLTSGFYFASFRNAAGEMATVKLAVQ